MKLFCVACDQRLGSPDELCGHRNPVGYCCCDTEHGGDVWAEDGDAA